MKQLQPDGSKIPTQEKDNQTNELQMQEIPCETVACSKSRDEHKPTHIALNNILDTFLVF